MKTGLTYLGSLVLMAAMLVSFGKADDWTEFRGGKGGVAPDKNLPEKVAKDNILWKVKLTGVGTSSPIVVGDKVFLTGYSGYGGKISKGGFGKGGKGGFGKGGFGKGGPADPEQKNLKLLLFCVDRTNGAIAWQKEIEPKLPETNFGGMIAEHGYASPTPVTDGKRVYAFFGKSGVVAFDMEGKQVWRVSVGGGTHSMGTAASPVLYKDILIANAAIESESLVGLDKKTGEEVWRAKGLGTCWASPILVATKDGKQEVVVSLPGKIVAYDPEKGSELWHCTGIGNAGGYGGTSPTPVARDGIVYVMGGGGPTPAATIAVKAGGKGDVTKTHVLWRQKTGGAYCSPVLVGDHLCWIDGVMQCLDIADGKTAFKERLYDGRGEYVSAVAAGSRVYALTRTSGLYVLDAAAKYSQLSHFEFEGDDSAFNASPAISNGRLYLRSNAYLYCLGKGS